MGLGRAQGKKFLYDANILQQNGDHTRDLTIFVSSILHCSGFRSIEILALIAFVFLVSSFSLDFEPGSPFKISDLLRFSLDLIISLEQVITVVSLCNQHDIIIGYSCSLRVFVALYTQIGHDDKRRKVFWEVFASNFSRFGFLYFLISSDLFKKLSYKTKSYVFSSDLKGICVIIFKKLFEWEFGILVLMNEAFLA